MYVCMYTRTMPYHSYKRTYGHSPDVSTIQTRVQSTYICTRISKYGMPRHIGHAHITYLPCQGLELNLNAQTQTHTNTHKPNVPRLGLKLTFVGPIRPSEQSNTNTQKNTHKPNVPHPGLELTFAGPIRPSEQSNSRGSSTCLETDTDWMGTVLAPPCTDVDHLSPCPLVPIRSDSNTVRM